jgi:hypothetical protein
MQRWNGKICLICLLFLIFIFYTGCKPIEIGEPLDTADTGSSNAAKKSGELTADEFWSKNILVESDVVIPKGISLTIDSGTKVKFSKNSRLIVNGTLYAEGKPNQSITLTSNEIDPKPGDWGGVIFSEDSLNSKLEYCVFQFHTQILCSSDSLRLNKCIIAEGSVAGIVFEIASPVIEDNMITQNATGIICDKSASPNISHNAITSNLIDGIECKGSSFAIISYNVINNNRKNGIYCHAGASPEISFNNFTYNGGWAVAGGGKLSNNFIKGNREQDMNAVDNRDSLSSSQYQGVENIESPRSTPVTEAGTRKEERW